MARIKHTKNELKAQMEALARFERYLPMLLLKKQQLQSEILTTAAAIAELEVAERRERAALDAWAELFAEDAPIEDNVRLGRVDIEEGNIAGVDIPVLKKVGVETREPDLFETPSWVDDAVRALEILVRLRVEREVLEEARRRITEELRVTAQRVNLFEKVKIPEARENIRVIRIFLGDERTAAVARGKIAKKRAEASPS